MLVQAKLFGIIGENHDKFKEIENENKNSNEYKSIQNYKSDIRKNVKYIQQSSTVKKNNVKDNIGNNNDIKKEDEIPNLGDDNKVPQMGGMGGF